MTNIHDIARKSGYSAATVSRVLNNRGYVSSIARAKIKSIIDELDYVPSNIARDLSQGKTFNIGVVLPHTKHPYFTQLLGGIILGAFSTKYRIVILPSEYDATLEIKYLEQLRAKAFDALIFTSHGISRDTLAEYTKYGLIILCEDPKRPDLQAVFSKRESAYREAFNWIKVKGINSAAVTLSRPYEISATAQKTLDTYKEIFGASPKNNLTFTDVVSYEDGMRVAKKMISQKSNVQCIFTNGDDIAAGVMEEYNKQGIQLPLLIGQENQLSSQLLNIPTIDHNFNDIGSLAFELATKKRADLVIPLESKFIILE